ncbi:hypothetical protein [Paenibacillus polymyxa]|uniref:Uncharacterized protein n=1 Tax=Paenibacillus polymyxa (strain SC2) TaxID=886882 RepID=E3EL85_PAEPS|nr:hypothetical protein [Paenibacillus polymyxa]ADO59917.2 hypothetical protein PPSC2_28580 [Paenibacillus polymyxa SC2]WPQ59859.1 hypothetical protein SKN87_26595 [Paenibacillus polymyxa]
MINLQERLDRAAKINDLIKYIGEIDKNRYKPLLHSKNEEDTFTQGYFIFAENGLLYFIDSYTRKAIRPIDSARYQRDHYFSHGGNMWWLVQSFAQFIMTGKEGQLRDYKEIWGFDYETTMLVREKAKQIGFISSVDYPHHLYMNPEKRVSKIH